MRETPGNRRSHGGRSGVCVACGTALVAQVADKVGLTAALSLRWLRSSSGVVVMIRAR